jgi:DNA-binding IclR family transcriptional regulator
MSKTILHRALTVIDAISKSAEGLRFSEVAKILDNPSPTTVNKILKELVHADVLEKTPSGRYALGWKIYFWGRAMGRKNEPIQYIREHMRRLHNAFNASVNLFTCVDDRMFCLESFMDPESPSLWQAGQSLELRLPVLGAVFFIPTDRLRDDAIIEAELQRHRHPVSPEDARRMIDHAASTGVQDDFALFYPGMHRFSVPLRENGQPVMAIGLGIMPARLAEDGLEARIVETLRDAQNQIEDIMNEN